MKQSYLNNIILVLILLNIFGIWTNYINYANSASGSDTSILQWYYDIGGDINTNPAIGDVDGDGLDEIIVGADNYYLYCISGDGSLKWKYFIGGSGNKMLSSPALGDIDGDGLLEILIGGDNGVVFCINGSGFQEWNYTTGESIKFSPALGDVDKDGTIEIIIASDNGIYCLDRNGSLKWVYNTYTIWSNPVIGDVDGDGAAEIVCGVCITYNRRIDYLWTYDIIKYIEYYVVCLKGDGSSSWIYEVLDVKFDRVSDKYWEHFGPALGDIDDDGQLEIIIGLFHSDIICLDGNGEKSGICIFIEWSRVQYWVI